MPDNGRSAGRWCARRARALLLEGHRAIPVIEALDQRGLLVRAAAGVGAGASRPQRNAYHRYTVDRHLWEAAANAAALADRVSRPDLLVLGALFHDLGKGYPGDHTEAGMELVAAIGPRLGPAARDVATLVRLVEHHLLLPTMAVRRDLADPATIRPGRRRRRRRGHARAAARAHRGRLDGDRAVGVGSWKEELVAELVARTRVLLERRAQAAPRMMTATPPTGVCPTKPTLAAMAAGRLDIRIEATTVTCS